MNRTNIYLTDEQRDQLDAQARTQGVSRAELIRQALDRVLLGESDQLDADLAAIEHSFGSLADSGDPSGQPTVDRRDGARGDHLRRISAL